DVARTGDEKIAALFGLQATSDLGDWSRQAELDEQRLAILPDEKPRVELLWKAELEAGRELLKAAADGTKRAGHEIQAAIARLQDVLAEIDDMGWPKSSRPNLTTVGDNVAQTILGLRLREDASGVDIRAGLRFAVERGLL